MNYSLFANCSQHYPIEILFESCLETNSPCRLIEDLNNAIYLAFVAYYASISLFSLAALANLYCLCVIIPMFFQMKDESRKRYIFLITRCISSFLTVISMLLVSTLESKLEKRTSNFYIYASLNIIANTNVFGLLGSYIGLAGLLYLGVVYPVFFMQAVTMRFIHGLVIAIYTASFVFSVPYSIFQAAIINPGVIMCDIKTCAPIINLVYFIAISLCLVATIVILSFVLFSLVRTNYKLQRSDTLSSSSNSMRRIRSRLAWTIIAVTIISVAELAPFAFLISASKDDIHGCQGFYRADKLLQDTVAVFSEILMWGVILLIDPVANIFCDKKVSERVRKQFSWLREHLLICNTSPSLLV